MEMKEWTRALKKDVKNCMIRKVADILEGFLIIW